jgi:hypothetical protein
MSGTGAFEQAAQVAHPAQADDQVPVGTLRRGRGRRVAAGVVVAVVGVAVALAVTDPFRTAASRGTGGTAYHTSVATVRLGSLTSQTQVDATLGHAGSYSVVNYASGTITWLPAVGEVIGEGQVLYQVSGAPVVLLYGSVPSWQDLAEGISGPDVAELNADLVRLGYATWAELGSGSDYFSAATAYGVEQLQAKLGVTETGTLTLGQAVFLPTAALITGLGPSTVLDGATMPGSVILTASSTTPVVTIALNAAQQTEVKDGEQVAITLPDGDTAPGVVSSVNTVASSSSNSSNSSNNSNSSNSSNNSNSSNSGSSATITVLVSLSNPKAAGNLNQAPVEVTISTGSVSDVLIVPVDALLAVPSGYVVEVIGAGGRHRLVPVTPGVFDDAAGTVQVTGAGLAVGQRVVVPVI